MVYYELIVLDFNDELRKKESGDVGSMKERVADEERDTGKVGTELIKDSGVNDLMMKNSDDELNVSMASCLGAMVILRVIPYYSPALVPAEESTSFSRNMMI